MSDFEVLVVGDGCTDDSETVVAAIDDRRVRWINLPMNTGHQSDPNNEGLRQAKGDLIAYLGHDDLWLPHHLEVLVKRLEDSDAGMAHSIVALVDADGAEVAATSRPAYGAWAPPSCRMHRRSVTETVGGWRDHREMTVAPEAELWLRAWHAGILPAFVPRLTAIKFPAGLRRRVYRTRPCHEQAAWSARIASEPDLELTLLTQIVAGGSQAARMLYRDLVRQFIGETFRRARRRFAQRPPIMTSLRGKKGAIIAGVRRFKGL